MNTWTKEAEKQYQRLYRIANKDRIKAQKKEWYESVKNDPEFKAKKSEKWAVYRDANPEKVSSKNKRWRENNKEHRKAYQAVFIDSHPGWQESYSKNYQIENRGRISARVMAKMKSDPQYKLARLLRSRLRAAIKAEQKRGSAVGLLGCSIAELKSRLESLWLTGMTWNNWTKYGWHIDHIKPLASFDLTDPIQLAQACHYSNLQPLWAVDNLSKGAKDFATWSDREAA